jgi:uncharacterized protein (TIGR03086 family)
VDDVDLVAAVVTPTDDGPTPLDLANAAAEIRRLLPGIGDDQLDAPTPCDYPVATLLDHLVGLTDAFRIGAQKGDDPVPDGPAPDGSKLASDWRDRLPRQLDALVAAWRDPWAWEGSTTVGGVTLPAEVVAVVTLDELVVHGWDLARATGQDFRCDPVSVSVVLAFTEASAEPGREAERDGLFGPVVAVPDDASDLDRALGFAGRDPAWRP